MRRFAVFFLCTAIVSGMRLPAAATGGVTVEICEQGVSKDGTWPTAAVATETYTEDLFGLFELPQKYISADVRADRPFPHSCALRPRSCCPP